MHDFEADDRLKRVKRIATSLKGLRRDYDPEFRQLGSYFLPRRALFSEDPVSQFKAERGTKQSGKILDAITTRSLRILQSGMQAGATSPSRPWFKLQTVDPDKRDNPAIKRALHRVTEEARRLAERSGLYNMLHIGYGDLGVYGNECGIIETTRRPRFLRPLQLVPGSYWLGMSGEDRVDTMYREAGMTVEQIVGRFVYQGNPRGEPQWERVTTQIKNMWDKGDIGEIVPVSHMITPRTVRDPKRLDKANKPIASEYWLRDDDRAESQRRMLEVSGYNVNPISASRWNVQGMDTWGTGPALDAMPDVLELMSKRRDYAEAIRRQNRPPMNAHSDLRNSAFSMLPGAVNFMADPAKGLVPTMQVNTPLGDLATDIQQSRDSVWSGMYADLFMMISQLDRRQITATEIDERREEKLIALGPVLERLHFEKLGPVVMLLVSTVMEEGLAGPMPDELMDEPIEIDFISMLAQAMKAIATGGMERFAGFVGSLASMAPDVLDKYDTDQAIDEYASMIGVPPTIVRADEEVDRVRAARQAQQQAQAAAATADQMAGAIQKGAAGAQTLAEADQPRGQAPGDILRKLGLA